MTVIRMPAPTSRHIARRANVKLASIDRDIANLEARRDREADDNMRAMHSRDLDVLRRNRARIMTGQGIGQHFHA